MWLLGKTMVKRLSGAKAYVVLEPTESFKEAQRQHNLYAPVFVLFGDQHRKLVKPCRDCEPSSSCFRLFDDPWFRALDSVASPNKTVDVNIELGVKTGVQAARRYGYSRTTGDTDVELIKYLAWRYNDCLSGRQCKLFDNIVFSISDPRSSIHFASSFTELSKVRLFESVIDLFLSLDMELVETLDRFFTDPSYDMVLPMMLAVARGVRDLYTAGATPQGLMGWYFSSSFFTPEYSEVAAQIDQCQGDLHEHDWWRSFALVIINKFSGSWSGLPATYVASLYDQLILSLESRSTKGLRQAALTEFLSSNQEVIREGRVLSSRLHGVTSLFFEMYTAARSFKRPRSTPLNSALSVKYMGLMHVAHLAYALVKTGMYELVSSFVPDDIDTSSTCLQLDEPIDFNVLLDETLER